MVTGVRRFAARFMPSLYRALRIGWYRRQLSRRTFRSPEPEWERLAEWVKPGDWAIDVGANIGHYTARLAELVGPGGHVVAFEPLPENFAILAALATAWRNVTLLQAGAADTAGETYMNVPRWADGTLKPYEARLSPDGDRRVLAFPIDALGIRSRVALVKIDVEGLEAVVIEGMRALLARSRPVVILEARREADVLLEKLGYHIETSPRRSPNRIAVPGYWQQPDNSGNRSPLEPET